MFLLVAKYNITVCYSHAGFVASAVGVNTPAYLYYKGLGVRAQVFRGPALARSHIRRISIEGL